jgi:hypothetical protein
MYILTIHPCLQLQPSTLLPMSCSVLSYPKLPDHRIFFYFFLSFFLSFLLPPSLRLKNPIHPVGR